MTSTGGGAVASSQTGIRYDGFKRITTVISQATPQSVANFRALTASHALTAGYWPMTGEKFFQICLRPSEGTDGPGLVRLLQCIVAAVGGTWAVLSDVDLIGPARSALATETRAVRVISVMQLLTLLEDAEQIVWASVFLCRSQEAAEQITGSEDYVAALEKSDGLVRVVDATYYYVYGPALHIAALAHELGGEQKEAFAADLDFPE